MSGDGGGGGGAAAAEEGSCRGRCSTSRPLVVASRALRNVLPDPAPSSSATRSGGLTQPRPAL